MHGLSTMLVLVYSLLIFFLGNRSIGLPLACYSKSYVSEDREMINNSFINFIISITLVALINCIA